MFKRAAGCAHVVVPGPSRSLRPDLAAGDSSTSSEPFKAEDRKPGTTNPGLFCFYEYCNRNADRHPTGWSTPSLDHLRALEAESIHIFREVVAEFERPVMLYSIGKDSSVLLRLAQKAFYPGPIPFPLLHVDTTYKFREMIEFRDSYTKEIGARLIVHTNEEAIADGTQPFMLGTQRCCGLLKTKSLLDALEAGGFDAAFGGARRDEERSRAKERIFSLRDAKGQWDPKNQRPELWNLLNGRVRPGESIRVFPLSNWTEIDVWNYIQVENIPIVPLYFAKEREVIVRGNSLLMLEQPFVPLLPGREAADGPVPHAIARLLALHRRDQVRRRHRPEDHRRADRDQALRAPAPHHRPRPGRIDGAQEARGLLLMSGLLRICTAGSVDDGKSTLIGRLLYDSRSVYEDQVSSVEKASKNRTAGPIDFSLFTDGLKAEREQGITIDVAYRYFATARRKFILADTPGHEQYTRNMATGASTADVAILLVDARNGVRVAVAAARADRAAARHHRLRARRQQDGPGRLRSRGLRRHRRRLRGDPAERARSTRFRCPR